MEPETIVPIDATLATPPTPTTPATTGDTVNWQDKYNGLSGAFKQEKTAKEQAILQLAELRLKYEGETTSLKSEKEQATTEALRLKSEAETARAEAATLKAERETRKVVSAKSSVLAEKFDKGFLRVEGLEGDALNQYLDDYLSDLEGSRRSAVRETVAGHVPAQSGGSANASMSTDELSKQLLTMQPGTAEYRAVEEAYFASLTKGNSR